MGIEVDADRTRRVLEERVVVVPGTQCVDRDPEAMRELFVELGLQHSERRGRDLVDLGQRGEQETFVEVGRRERQREMVAVAE